MCLCDQSLCWVENNEGQEPLNIELAKKNEQYINISISHLFFRRSLKRESKKNLSLLMAVHL